MLFWGEVSKEGLEMSCIWPFDRRGTIDDWQNRENKVGGGRRWEVMIDDVFTGALLPPGPGRGPGRGRASCKPTYIPNYVGVHRY